MAGLGKAAAAGRAQRERGRIIQGQDHIDLACLRLKQRDLFGLAHTVTRRGVECNHASSIPPNDDACCTYPTSPAELSNCSVNGGGGHGRLLVRVDGCLPATVVPPQLCSISGSHGLPLQYAGPVLVCPTDSTASIVFSFFFLHCLG